MFCNQISNSKRNTWRECKLKYKYNYVDRIKETDKGNKSALQFGSYIHEIFELGVEAISIGELERIAKELKGKYSFDASYNPKVKTCLKNFLRLNSSLSEVGHAELRLTEDLGCVKHLSIIDRVVKGKNGGILVLDYKTGKREKSKFDLFKCTQGRSYTYAVHKELGVPLNKITFAHYYPLTDNLVTVSYSPADIADNNRKIVEDAWKIKKAKVEDLIPSENQYCNWCGYKSVCPIFNPKELVEERLLNAEKKPKRSS